MSGRCARVVFTDANGNDDAFGIACATYDAPTNGLVEMYHYSWATQGLTSTERELVAVAQGYSLNRKWLYTTPGAFLTIYTDCRPIVAALNKQTARLPGLRFTKALAGLHIAIRDKLARVEWCRRSSSPLAQADWFARQAIKQRAARLAEREL